MKSLLNPYLSFRDNAREAMAFYQSIFGGRVQSMTFKDFHVSEDPGEDEKIMHSMLENESGLTFMAADTPNRMKFDPGARISMALSGDDETELTAYFNGLASGGTINDPLTKSPWGDTFGSVTDKFGINWMVNIAGKKE